MTPRENFIHFLKNEPCEWTPTSADQCFFRPAAIPDNIARAMVQQQVPYEGEWGGKDMFGVEWVYVPTVGGSMETGIMFEDIEDWKKYVKIPDPDSIDWEGCAKANAEYLNTDKILYSTIYTGYFERLISFVGFESSAMALIDEDEQELVHELFQKLTDYYIEIIRRMKKYFNIEIVEVHDDWGNQRSLMFSVNTHKEMIVPYMQQITKAAHEMGVFIEMHSCGKIEGLMPNLIDTGVDTWRGQASVIDKKFCVDNYGDRFKFGVEIRPESPLPTDEAMALADKILADYHGKNVWIILGRTLGAEASDLIYKKIRAMGRI